MNFTHRSFCIFFVLSSVFNNSTTGQHLAFKVIGNIKGLDSGSVTTIMIGSSDKFRDIQMESTSSPVSNGKFSIHGTLNYPHAVVFLFQTENKFIPSDLIYITDGVQEFECDIDSIKYKAPVIANSSLSNEYFLKLLPAGYDSVLLGYDIYETNIKKLSIEKDASAKDSLQKQVIRDLTIYKESKIRFAFSYVKQNPASYIGLWQIVDNFCTMGYLPLIDSSLKYLSSDIKKTKTGKYLEEAIEIARALSIGETFPNEKFYTINERTKKLSSYRQNQFLLIDFWYSNCGPCIKEFPELLKIYNKYNSIGFEIITISTDKVERKQNWIDAISKYKLTWKHLWDKNGSYATRNFINSFPTNFLLDQNKRIIAKNIKPEELDFFLRQNLIEK